MQYTWVLKSLASFLNIRSIRGRRTLQSLWRFPDVQSCGLTVCWRPASDSGVQGEQRVVAVFIRPGAFQSHTIAIIINSLCRVQSQAPRSTPPLFSPSVPPALLTFFFYTHHFLLISRDRALTSRHCSLPEWQTCRWISGGTEVTVFCCRHSQPLLRRHRQVGSRHLFPPRVFEPQVHVRGRLSVS